VSDKRENEYFSGRKLQYKSVCYFFKIDKEHIIDATRKGGFARFINHSCLVCYLETLHLFIVLSISSFCQLQCISIDVLCI